MAEYIDPELTTSHRHTKIRTTYKATIYENDLKTSRKDFPQLKTKRRNHSEKGWRGGDMVESGPIVPGQRSTNGRNITIIEVLPKE